MIKKLGRYEIVLELGHGAMGTVYKAVDPLIERTVAIKAINLDLPKDEFQNFEERFYREAKSAGRLNHPNIVTIFDAGEADNTAYIAMEFLEGQSLREILDSGKSLANDRISEIAAQIADGLAYAQQHGIVHRDIKPANIMITSSGQVKITDFGIAHLPSGSKTQSGTILGSPKYMSPEQIVGETVDGRSDIFSLGVMLYEMVAGKPPFEGESVSNIMYRILNEMPADIREINKKSPSAFAYIIYKTLAKLPQDRYQSASELAHDLRHYKTLPLPPPAQLAAMTQVPQKTLERRVTPRIDATEATLETTLVLPAGADTHKKFFTSKVVWAVTGALAAVVASFFVFHGKSGPENEKPIAPHIDVSSAAKPIAKSTGTGSDTTPLPPSTPTAKKKTPTTAQSDKKTKAPPIVAGKAGYLYFEVTPRGEIYLDGKDMGVSPPLKKLALTAGMHRVEVQSGYPPYTYIFKINVEANKSTVVKAEFKSKR
jgi:serine/threonine-protein kinase